MSYVDGFLIAVPAANREKFVEYAKLADSINRELGATRVVECWVDDVTEGNMNAFRRAVQADSDEIVAFSWCEWPSKEVRDKAVERLNELIHTDERFDAEKNPAPFDGMKIVFGGFEVVVDI